MQDYSKDPELLSSWLVSKGYPYELQQQYRRRGWMKLIGTGVMLKIGNPFLLSSGLQPCNLKQVKFLLNLYPHSFHNNSKISES